MSIVRAHWTPQSQDHTIYFRPDGVSGPGFGNDNPTILAELVPLLQVIKASMGEADFFISIIPEANHSFARARIGENIAVPDFGRAFAPIATVLAAHEIEHDCDIEIAVCTGRGMRLGGPSNPSLELSVYERVPDEFGRLSRCRLYLPVSLDASSSECKSILAWYAGAAHGVVSWTSKRTVDAQNVRIARATPSLIAQENDPKKAGFRVQHANPTT